MATNVSSEVFKNWLTKNRIKLVDGIMIEEIIHELYAQKVITHDSYERITSNQKTSNEKTRKLLDILYYTHVTSAIKFVEILQHKLPHVFEDLTPM